MQIEKYLLLSDTTSEKLTKLVQDTITNGVVLEGNPHIRVKGWELFEKPSVSQSSGKTPQGHSFTYTTFCQAMIIQKGNLIVVDNLSKYLDRMGVRA